MSGTSVRAPRPAPSGLGLSSAELLRLLDPESAMDPEERMSLIEVLRSHPSLAGDFARLDALARDAQTESYARAIELHQMFEELRKQRQATPAEVLGEQVPYRGLLAIAQARIERARKPPTRLLEVQEQLVRAEEAAVELPVAAFSDALVELGISESGAERALEEARRRVAAGVGRTQEMVTRQAP